jgi:hypothetical protein
MRNAMLIAHIPVMRARITLFLSQIANLMAFISFAKGFPEEDEHAKHDQERRGSEGDVG